MASWQGGLVAVSLCRESSFPEGYLDFKTEEQRYLQGDITVTDADDVIVKPSDKWRLG